MHLALKNELDLAPDKITSVICGQIFAGGSVECIFETAVKGMGLDYFIALSILGDPSVDPEPVLTEGSTQIIMTEQFVSFSGTITFNPFLA